MRRVVTPIWLLLALILASLLWGCATSGGDSVPTTEVNDAQQDSAAKTIVIPSSVVDLELAASHYGAANLKTADDLVDALLTAARGHFSSIETRPDDDGDTTIVVTLSEDDVEWWAEDYAVRRVRSAQDGYLSYASSIGREGWHLDVPDDYSRIDAYCDPVYNQDLPGAPEDTLGSVLPYVLEAECGAVLHNLFAGVDVQGNFLPAAIVNAQTGKVVAEARVGDGTFDIAYEPEDWEKSYE